MSCGIVLLCSPTTCVAARARRGLLALFSSQNTQLVSTTVVRKVHSCSSTSQCKSRTWSALLQLQLENRKRSVRKLCAAGRLASGCWHRVVCIEQRVPKLAQSNLRRDSCTKSLPKEACTKHLQRNTSQEACGKTLASRTCVIR